MKFEINKHWTLPSFKNYSLSDLRNSCKNRLAKLERRTFLFQMTILGSVTLGERGRETRFK